jgi:hypothetical protein
MSGPATSDAADVRGLYESGRSSGCVPFKVHLLANHGHAFECRDHLIAHLLENQLECGQLGVCELLQVLVFFSGLCSANTSLAKLWRRLRFRQLGRLLQ